MTFTFYMIHTSTMSAVLKAMPSDIVDWRWTLAISLLVTVAVAAILHVWIEKPGREIVLALCERKPREIGLRLRRQLMPVRAHSPAFVAVGFLCLLPWIPPAIARIQFPISLDQDIAVTPQELRGVVFRDEARMVAIAADYDGNRFQLKAVYERLPHSRRNLMVHVLDSDGKVRQQLRPSIESVVDESGKALIVATVNEPITRLEGTTAVGVVFWSKESKAAHADRGPRSMGGHRLHIYEIPGRIGSMPRPLQNSDAGQRRG